MERGRTSDFRLQRGILGTSVKFLWNKQKPPSQFEKKVGKRGIFEEEDDRKGKRGNNRKKKKKKKTQKKKWITV